MTIEDTIPDGFVFAPETDDAIQCEFNTQELKTFVQRPSMVLVHDVDRAKGYDPYNTGAHPRFVRPLPVKR